MGWASSGRGLTAALLLFLLFFFTSALGASATAGGRGRGGGGAVEEGYYFQDRAAAARRRQLVGPGSSPPTCRSRCGGCHPCRPVHVAIQPGRSFPLEYYPEAWRCKCGDRLYMP